MELTPESMAGNNRKDIFDDDCVSCDDAKNIGAGGNIESCGSLKCITIAKLRAEIARRVDEEAAKDDSLATLRTQNRELRGQEGELRVQVTKLLQQLGRRGQHTRRTWPDLVRARLLAAAPDDAPPGPWDDIYKQCCKEENMSTRIEWIHPNIRIAASDPIFEMENPEPVPDEPFSFERLPWEIQSKIFKLWLYKKGHLIHPLSRLDPFVALQAIPDAGQLQNTSGLPRGFYWGKSPVSVTHDRKDPNDVLRILLVSKRFFFIGVHCFYGLNTFAFSSLGEFDRFCNGIGTPRVGRLQHLELTWHGNQYLTIEPPPNKNRIPFSRRTFGLYALQECYRLRTLVIHVNETARLYKRRPYEPLSIQTYMEKKTAGQPNARMTRALRTLQGIDCVYQIRGLSWVRFYDLEKAINPEYTGDRIEVRDWSFAEDVTNTTTMQKVPSRRENSKLENLPPLLGEGGWAPTAEDWGMIKSYYIDDNGRCSYDHLRRQGHHQDLDIPSQFTATDPSAGTERSDRSSTPSSSSSSGSDSNSNSNSSSDSGSLGGGGGGRGGAESDDSSSDSSDDDNDDDNNNNNEVEYLSQIINLAHDTDSDSESDLFVRQPTPNSANQPLSSPSPMRSTTSSEPTPDIEVTGSRPLSLFGGGGGRLSSFLSSLRNRSTMTPAPLPRRRDSSSSGLFVTPRLGSVKEEDVPVILPEHAGQTFDLTGGDTPTSLSTVIELPEDEDEQLPDAGTTPSNAGSKHRRPEDDANEGKAEGSPPKRQRTSSPDGAGEAGPSTD